MRYQQNTKTLIKNFTFFKLNRLFLDQLHAKKLYRLGKNWSDLDELA